MNKAYTVMCYVEKLGFSYVLSSYNLYIGQKEIAGFCDDAVAFYHSWSYIFDSYSLALKEF